jgi:CRP-like cAMP-binding protein
MNSRIESSQSIAAGALRAHRTFDLDTFAADYGGVTVSKCRAGTLLYRQGESADAMYYLQSGQIQITVVSSQGKEGILGLLDPGGWCGEGCLLGNRQRVATASCLADSVVARLERGSVLRGIRQNPLIAEFFVAFALRKVIELRGNLISQLFDSSERRLARALLVLANHGRGEAKNGSDAKNNVIMNIDQEGLAQMIGTTRPRVNHFMNKFRRLGHIDYEGGVIFVHSSLANMAFSDDVAPPNDAIAIAW